MSKWSRGPWKTDLISVTDETGYQVCWDATEPDAHLIAAAPDLYDALQAMVDYCNAECGSKIYPEHQANQALAKARGETQ